MNIVRLPNTKWFILKTKNTITITSVCGKQIKVRTEFLYRLGCYISCN